MAPEEIPKDPNDHLPIDGEFSDELGQINAEVNKEADKARLRLGELLNAKDVLEKFLGNGIAYMMPLGEIIMFLEVRKEEAEKGGSSHAPRELAAAREMLISLIGQDLSEKSEYIDVIRYMEKETGKLEDIAEAGI